MTTDTNPVVVVAMIVTAETALNLVIVIAGTATIAGTTVIRAMTGGMTETGAEATGTTGTMIATATTGAGTGMGTRMAGKAVGTARLGELSPPQQGRQKLTG